MHLSVRCTDAFGLNQRMYAGVSLSATLRASLRVKMELASFITREKAETEYRLTRSMAANVMFGWNSGARCFSDSSVDNNIRTKGTLRYDTLIARYLLGSA